jgi:hypothetical protein
MEQVVTNDVKFMPVVTNAGKTKGRRKEKNYADKGISVPIP